MTKQPSVFIHCLPPVGADLYWFVARHKLCLVLRRFARKRRSAVFVQIVIRSVNFCAKGIYCTKQCAPFAFPPDCCCAARHHLHDVQKRWEHRVVHKPVPVSPWYLVVFPRLLRCIPESLPMMLRYPVHIRPQPNAFVGIQRRLPKVGNRPVDESVSRHRRPGPSK